MTDNTQSRVAYEVGTVGDCSVDVASVLETDEGGTHAAPGNFSNAETTLMVQKVTDEHGVRVKLVRIRWWDEGDNCPIS